MVFFQGFYFKQPMTNKIFSFNSSFRLLLAAVCLMFALQVSSQRRHTDYQVIENVVLYRGTPLLTADPYSIVDLGYGYAKDTNHVYYLGEVLKYVDPYTFRLKRMSPHDGYRPYDSPFYHSRGYKIMSNVVLFNGHKVYDASVNSFRDLGGGYAKDAFNVYFMGEKMSGGSTHSFQYLGDGYAKDSFDVYFLGRKVNGASANSFRIVGEGYAEDTFNTFYQGQKIN